VTASVNGSDWLGLRDAVCVVTGAGSGIGRDVCLEFARAGAKVVAVDLSEEGSAATAKQVQEAGSQEAAPRATSSTTSWPFTNRRDAAK
jgi:NAD(P)-dependent dehydrogenase (short-subunit alcohol dehydrogenase family)